MGLMRGADAILDTLEAGGTELLVGYIGHTTQEWPTRPASAPACAR